MNTANLPASLPVKHAPPARGDAPAKADQGSGEQSDFAKLAGMPAKQEKKDDAGRAVSPAPAEDGDQAVRELVDAKAGLEEGLAESEASNRIADASQLAPVAAEDAAPATQVPQLALATQLSQISQAAVRLASDKDGSTRQGNSKPADDDGSVKTIAPQTEGRQAERPLIDAKPADDARRPETTRAAVAVDPKPADTPRTVAPPKAETLPQPAASAPGLTVAQTTTQAATQAASINAERNLPPSRAAEQARPLPAIDRQSMPATVTTTGLEAANKTTPAGVTVASFWQYVAGNSGPTIVNTLPAGEVAQQPSHSAPSPVSLQVQLHPKTLGMVNVAISRIGNVVSVEIVAQTQQAEQLLKSDAGNLAEAFRNADGKIEEVQIRIAASSETNATGLRGAREGEREAFGQAFGDGGNLANDEAGSDRGEPDDLSGDAGTHADTIERGRDDPGRANHRTGLYL